MSKTKLRQLRMVQMGALGCALGLMVAMTFDSNIWMFLSSLFWISVSVFNVTSFIVYWPSGYGVAALLRMIGGGCNMIACMANGGRMPVLYPTMSLSRWWQPFTANTRVPFLCDVLWQSSSVGDLFLAASLLTTLGVIVYGWRKTDTPPDTMAADLDAD